MGKDVSSYRVQLPPTDDEKAYLPKLAPTSFDVSHIDAQEAMLKL
jgi:hypothetical protein